MWRLTALSCLLCLVLMEAGLRAFGPLPDPYEPLREPKNKAYIPARHTPEFRLRARIEPGLSGLSGVQRFTINAQGFRGDVLQSPKPPREHRVFLIGGSTTECGIIDDARAPHTKAQALLGGNFKVINAGHSGDASYDHVAVLAHHIAHLEPDTIVLKAGVNDLIASIRGRDYLHLRPHNPIRLQDPTLLRMLLMRAQLARRIWSVSNPIKARISSQLAQDAPVQTIYRTTAERCQKRQVTSEPPPLQLDAFRRNLRSIIGLARAHRARVILATQPSSWDGPAAAQAWHWMTCHGAQRFDHRKMAAALNEYNRVIRELARAEGAPLLDLAARFPRSLELLYDDVHLNQKGSDAFAAAIAGAVRASLQTD